MDTSAENIAKILDANWQGNHSLFTIDNVSVDSRSLQNGANTLFFAISGPNNDAHIYIPELISKGVKNFVVSKIPTVADKQVNFFIVRDTVQALQQFAAYHRSRFDFPVIGITGSNGKTIVKEWLNFLLAPDFNIIRSPKSYNSQIGVPLSVLGINENHNFGLFEAGISTTNEMAKLEVIIRPTIGILTNIGSAHDEGFPDKSIKIAEKLKLFNHAKVVIFEKLATIDTLISQKKSFTWSFQDRSADVFISKFISNENTHLTIEFNSGSFIIAIPFVDEASVENAISSLMVLIYLKYDETTIRNRMLQLFPVEMRLEVKNGINNTTIIDDSYSSDYQSLKIALDFLENQNQYNHKTAILSDIYQSGLPNDELYERLSQLVKSNKIGRVIGIGPIISQYQSKFDNSIVFNSTEDFMQSFDTFDFANETILVKGARKFKFEEIVAQLEEKNHETVLEINLNAISHNLNFYKSKIRSGTKIMVMVKAFGYGSGGFEIARLLEHHKVDYLGVAFADEGIALKNAGIKLPIMVLNPESTSYAAIIQNGLEPEIYSLKGLQSFIKIAKTKNLMHFPIHIKLDTGMHRLGFDSAHFPELIALLKSTNTIIVKSIFSHMATSDDRNHSEFALLQINLFKKLSSKLMSELGISPFRHLLNTSGIENFPEAQYDMVRLGIGLYGISNDSTEQKSLENVSTLKSIISQVRNIKEGESVGYGRKFIAEKDTKIATIPIGYADGISRLWGNGVGYITINNQKALIVGSVCMDMLMVDCTNITCNEGDSVVIFGKSPTVNEMATALKTIPYEILTGISQRVKRIFYRE